MVEKRLPCLCGGEYVIAENLSDAKCFDCGTVRAVEVGLGEVKKIGDEL
jgi:hypothetical protein